VLFGRALVKVQKGEQKAATFVVAFLFLGQKREVISVIQRGEKNRNCRCGLLLQNFLKHIIQKVTYVLRLINL
jgi:hypothetical protein